MVFVYHFSLEYIFGTNYLLSNHISFEKMLKKYGINIEKIKVFNEYDNYYFNEKNDVIDIEKRKHLDACMIGDKAFDIMSFAF